MSARRSTGLSLTRPGRESAADAPRRLGATDRERAELVDEGVARIVVDVPRSQHVAVKRRALERGLSVRDYTLELYRADGVFDAESPRKRAR
jgi:hypothetical protein